ncbi:hypothetical protein V7O66_05805 [Methanolobus sp. ZRKC3]|uniref:hypothetical protein n=1 Tax=Methanolobus sp. ZRKC3 TaxID=3125786 RepID=UPI0032548A8F
MREDESNISMNIQVHEFINKNTWSLHLALHVNNVFVGTASANPGNSRYDNETVVAAMKCLKNHYFKTIGSPMRYKDGKLVFLPADQGIEASSDQEIAVEHLKTIPASGQAAALFH